MDEIVRLIQFGVFALLVWGAYLSFMGRDRRKRERRLLSRTGDGGRRNADRWKDAPQLQKEKSRPAQTGPVVEPDAEALSPRT
jgi:hypothetical protein